MAKEPRATVEESLERLETLGNGERIAAYLFEQGVRGSRYAECPLENFLREQTGLRISVGRDTVISWRGDGDKHKERSMKNSCVDFVLGFDKGRFPDLRN